MADADEAARWRSEQQRRVRESQELRQGIGTAGTAAIWENQDCWPDWADGEQTLMIRTRPLGIDARWRFAAAPQPAHWVADWLEEKVGRLSAVDLSGEERFAVVVLRRMPTQRGELGEIAKESPVSRFAYGSLPASDDQAAMPLRDLLEEAIAILRS